MSKNATLLDQIKEGVNTSKNNVIEAEKNLLEAKQSYDRWLELLADALVKVSKQ